ncbi:hypothetical protein [Thermococcus sp. AM4]|uniref:hypothetical protein n=1 Tax=Thermococcus sp. (strain AM4) TaxID=246969 RepID=UPI0001871011|nr:hypothetical protein [Thermococcus sp. AM4]EEB74324.1 hypothetical protein TAM4_1691 [Thermococcus sp. AM4]
MKIRPMIKHYSKVFLSFLLLVFLVAVLPATASALVNQATEMRLGEFSGNYFSLRFLPKDYNEGGIIYLKSEKEAPTGAESPRSVKVYGGLSVNDVRKILASAGIRATKVYLPLYVSDHKSNLDWIIFVPLIGGYEGADCYVSGEMAAEKIEGVKIKYYYYDSSLGYDRIATIRIGTVKVLPRNDEKSRVLRAVLKSWEKYDDRACIASPDFARKLLKPYGVGDDLGELSVGDQGIIAITDGSQGVDDIYRAISREAAKHNLSVVMKVVTPRWVFAVESSTGRSLWDYLWGYIALFLPALPALLVIMGRERKDEERMRYLISTSGGRKIVLDLITAGAVLLALALVALFLERRAALLSAVMLLLVYVLRNFLAGRELGKRYTLVAFPLVLLGILGVLLHYNLQLRLYASGILGYLLSLGSSDASLLLTLVAFKYLPGILISIGALSLVFLAARVGKPGHKAVARLLFPGIVSIGVLFLYTGLLFSTPLVSLASVVDTYSGGATGAINFADSKELPKVYNMTLEAVLGKGVVYSTLWKAGTVVQGSGMTYSTHGRLLCYDRDFLEFLKKAGGISTTAQLLYHKLSSNPGAIVVPEYYLDELKRAGAVRISGKSLTFTVVDDEWSPHEISGPYETVDLLPGNIDGLLVSCEVARKNGLNPKPAFLLLNGDSKTTGEAMEEVNRTAASYPEAFDKLWSLKGISTHVESQFGDPRSFIPSLLSGVLMIATGLVVGLRDGERLSKLAELMKVNGEEPLALPAVVAPILFVLAFVPASMIRDGYYLASTGFVSGKLMLLGLVPLLGLFAGLLLYFASILRKVKGV